MKFLLSTALILLVSSSGLQQANAFAPLNIQSSSSSSASSSKLSAQKIGSWDGGGEFDPNSVGGNSSIQSIEFKIYPDGRVEEKVIGVKGNNCHSVTEKINESLGKVIESAPTEELYEQEVVVNVQETISNSVSTDDGTGGSGDSWEGQSSW